MKIKINLIGRSILTAVMLFFVFIEASCAQDCTDYAREAENYLNANDSGSAGVLYDNAGICYYNAGDCDNALEYFEKSTVYSLKAEDYAQAGVTYDNMGMCYYARENY